MKKAKETTKKAKAKESQALTIEPLKMQEVGLCVVGSQPLIFNRKSFATQCELLLPAVKKNAAAKRKDLKHDPYREYQQSVYTDPRADAPARLTFPSSAFKNSAMTAALEIPGATKASIGRLLQVAGYRTHIWGVPKLLMSEVRQAGVNKTPDIRTRAILPEWATVINVRYPIGTIEPSSVGNLFAAAGQLCGIGDWRQEKGKGNFGLFMLVSEDDETFRRIVATGGREAQDDALANPEPYDEITEALWSWYETEIVMRGRETDILPRGAFNPTELGQEVSHVDA